MSFDVKKKTFNFFLLFSPNMFLAILAIKNLSFDLRFLVLGLVVYNAVLIKNFLDTYYGDDY